MEDHSERVMAALTRLLSQKDEIKAAIAEVAHNQQLMESRTTAEFGRIANTLTGIDGRVSSLERAIEEAEDTKVVELRRQLDEERAKSGKITDNALKAVGGTVMMVVGGIISWMLRKILG